MIEPRLRLLSSDRLEVLADDLARRMDADPLPPLCDEVVVVGSRGMARWLNQHLAHALGVAGSIDTPFPFTWARRTVDALLERDGDPALDPFGAGRLSWRVHRLLGSLDRLNLSGDERRPLERYLSDDDDGRKRGQLALRLARQFVNYQVQRPEGLRRWEKGAWFEDEALDRVGERWQAATWRALVREADDTEPLSSSIARALARLRGSELPPSVPPRVTVFGVSSLPPLVLELLAALSERIEVTVATVSATSKYVGDAPRRRRARFEKLDPADLDHIHPLIPAWGRLGIDLQELLLDAGDHAELDTHFEAREVSSVLAQLQRDLFDACMPETPGALDRPRIRAGDRSLRLHLCHSPRREMEVLRDEILRAFDEETVHSPGDVLVLVPDVEAYAPFVRAVFESERPTSAGTVKLPVRIADGRAGEDDPYVRLAMLFLRRAGGRATATEILEILELAPVARRFGLDGVDHGSIRELVRRAGIRFGRDPHERAAGQDLPEMAGGTWREGLDRLLLGFAVGPADQEVDGSFPVADVTTGRASTLGRLVRAVETIFVQLDALERPRSLADWCATLAEAVVTSTEAADTDDARARVDLNSRLDAMAHLGEEDDTVARSTFERAFDASLADDASGRGFVSGSITVAELRPMRSIPYEMIAVAGLDSDSFPRRDPAEGLDLVVAHPKRGDRTPRFDDRQMMLEVVTAARRRLVLTAVGFEPRDNAERARSVCVDELMEAVDHSFVTDDTVAVDASPSEALTVKHRLQPFHVDYGAAGEHFTYDEGFVEGARALEDTNARTIPFVDEARAEDGLVRDGRGRVVIALDDLAVFWKSPSRWFVKNVLGMALHYDDGDLDHEPFDVDDRDQWRVRDFAFDHAVAGVAPERIAMLAERQRGLVSGPSGRLHARRLIETAIEKWQGLRENAVRRTPRRIEIATDDYVIEGSVDVVPGRGRDQWLSVGSVKDKVLAEELVRHVAFGCIRSRDDADPWATRIFGSGSSGEMRGIGPIDGVQAQLDAFVQGYVEGQVRPLHFFPATTAAWWKALDGNDPDEPAARRAAWVEAAPKWEGSDFDSGDVGDESVVLCTRGVDPVVDDDFVRWARVFGPLFGQVLKNKKDLEGLDGGAA